MHATLDVVLDGDTYALQLWWRRAVCVGIAEGPRDPRLNVALFLDRPAKPPGMHLPEVPHEHASSRRWSLASHQVTNPASG